MGADTGLTVYYWPGFLGRSSPIVYMLIDSGVQFTQKTPNDLTVLKKEGFAVPCVQEGELFVTQTCACMQYLAERDGVNKQCDNAQDKAKAAQLALDAADISSECFSKKGGMLEGDSPRLGSWMKYLEEQYSMVEGPFRFGAEPKYCDY